MDHYRFCCTQGKLQGCKGEKCLGTNHQIFLHPVPRRSYCEAPPSLVEAGGVQHRRGEHPTQWGAGRCRAHCRLTPHGGLTGSVSSPAGDCNPPVWDRGRGPPEGGYARESGTQSLCFLSSRTCPSGQRGARAGQSAAAAKALPQRAPRVSAHEGPGTAVTCLAFGRGCCFF